MVTVNDYLARRDSEWMGPMYQFHGLTVDCIDRHQPNSDARRKAYMADITFGTNNEYGFDYLRDNMASSPKDLVQRKHHYAIVDEVDSVLIDDARTPLIISGPVPKGDDQLFEQYRPAIEHLYNLQKNLVTNLLAESRQLLGEGKNEEGGIKLYRSHKGLPKYKPLIKFLSEQGIKAQMQKTENIYMQDNNRRMPEITDDLYFVIDEKMNSVELTDKGHEALSKYFNEEGFFVLPDIGARIAEIEKEEITPEEKAQKRDAVINDYAVKAERVHTVIQLLKAYAMFEKDVEYVVMDNKVKIVDEQTGRILDGRRYSDGLHQAIEAKERVKVEAATQTFATITLQNYFRMYHKLAGMTGTAETEASEFWSIYKLDVVVIPTNRKVIRDDRQDLVYKTKREKYNAVIEEIVKLVEQGRPVLVGTTSVEISELLSRMLKLRGIKHNVLNAKQHQLEAQIVAEAGRSGQVTIATNMAGRGTDIKLTPEVKQAGGLAIIGTERHESRRVDRQLRGRAGRQGDPGSSQFFVSLEDDLMRLFGSGRIASMMDRMGLKEGEVIQAGLMTKAIERAQKKVEENNFGIRKRLLEYDDVMNSQREVIYTRRRHALYGERIEIDLNNIMYDFATTFVENHEGVEFDDFRIEMIREAAIQPSFDEAAYEKAKPRELIELIVADLQGAYTRRMKAIADMVRPVMERVYEDRKGQLWLAGLAACTPIPENVTRVKECAPIYPDYTDITIPYNIAPLNFMIEGAEGLQVTAYGDTDSLRISGKDKARFPIGKWKKLLLQQKGKSVQVRVTALMKGKWLEYPSFQWQVAAEAIDGYLSYRLIEPGYEVWNNLQLCERSLEDFSEKVIACNRGKCLRCHFRSRQCIHSHLLRCCLCHLGLIMQGTDHG